MRQLTVTIPDEFYETFTSFLKFIPDVIISENDKPKDYLDSEEAKDD